MARVPSLVAKFDGAIKYLPMVLDHPEWTDEQCLAFAKKHHATAISQLREALKRYPSLWGAPVEDVRALNLKYARPTDGEPIAWNSHIPHCRHIPTAAMLKEAGL